MAQEFADDPAVIGWQIDNEIYSFGNGCFCPNCQAKFRERLRKKYKTIDSLNQAWNLNLFSQWYDDFSEIPAPRDAWHNPHLIQEWKIFQNDSHVEFVHRQAKILHKYVKVPVGTDTMPVNGMDYRKLTEKLDIVQFNHYNVPENLYCCAFWFDYLRTLKEHPFWNTETATCWNGSTAITQSIKPEGYCRANSWLPIALGGEANMYWLWRTHWAGHELVHGAVIDSSGRDMHTVSEVKDVAHGFHAASRFLTGTRVRPDAAIHFTSLSWNMHECQKVVEGWEYMPTVQDTFYRPMTRRGLRPDVIDSGAALDSYKLIFSPMVMSLDDRDLSARMAQWVKDGGVWVVGPLTDVRNADGTRYRDRFHGMLESLTGARWAYNAPDRESRIQAAWQDGKAFQGNTWYEMWDADDDALVKVTGGHSAIEGKALVSLKPVGKGWVLLLGTLPSEKDMDRILRLVCEKSGVALPQVEGDVMVCPRRGEAGEGLVLVEYGCGEAAVTLDAPMTDLLTGRRLQGKIHLKPYDVLVLQA